MVRDGIPFVIVPIVLAVIPVVLGYWWAAIPVLLIAAFMAFFFRNPERSVPLAPGLVLAPADGRITIVRPADADHSESLVSIFLSPLDVHINRAPIAGEIVEIAYKKGKFMMATKDESRLLNEQNRVTIKGDHMTISCTQIAGILARRIVCWKRRGERVECGERFGMIKFGSRTDLLMPPEIEIVVKVGMHVRGGETIIGKNKN
jgi:phosphatidylserine decarboxylase